MKNLQGRVAVVTGAAGGIGLAMASRFSAAGMALALVDVDAEALAPAAETLRRSGADVMEAVVDVADAEAMQSLADSVLERFGGVHIVCNNAGVAAGGPMWELSLADWEFVLRVNLWGVVHGIRAFTPLLLEQDEGHIVNTASMAGLISMVGMGPYNATKQAVVAISETLLADLRAAGSKVGVSVLCPGFVNTSIWDSDRNRPEHLRNPAAETSVEAAAAKDMIRGIIEGSMPPEAIGDAVHDAVLQERFYILTHESTLPVFEDRARRILDGRGPGESSESALAFLR